MQYPVLLHRDGTGRYEAVSLTVPTCAGKGENRNEALMDLKRLPSGTNMNEADQERVIACIRKRVGSD